MNTLRMTTPGDQITSTASGVTAGILFMYCKLLNASDSVQHIVYSIDPATLELVKFIGTTIFGFIGSALALWVKYKIEELKYRKRDGDQK